MAVLYNYIFQALCRLYRSIVLGYKVKDTFTVKWDQYTGTSAESHT